MGRLKTIRNYNLRRRRLHLGMAGAERRQSQSLLKIDPGDRDGFIREKRYLIPRIGLTGNACVTP